MTPELREVALRTVREELPQYLRIQDIAMVGTAYIIETGHAQDIDVLLLVPEIDPFKDWYVDQGYEVGGSGQGDEIWVSLKKGVLNILLCEDPTYFERWKAARRSVQVPERLGQGQADQRPQHHHGRLLLGRSTLAAMKRRPSI